MCDEVKGEDNLGKREGNEHIIFLSKSLLEISIYPSII